VEPLHFRRSRSTRRRAKRHLCNVSWRDFKPMPTFANAHCISARRADRGRPRCLQLALFVGATGLRAAQRRRGLAATISQASSGADLTGGSYDSGNRRPMQSFACHRVKMLFALEERMGRRYRMRPGRARWLGDESLASTRRRSGINGLRLAAQSPYFVRSREG